MCWARGEGYGTLNDDLVRLVTTGTGVKHKQHVSHIGCMVLYFESSVDGVASENEDDGVTYK